MGISLTGLASGLDTSAMIEGLMKLERMPLVNMDAHKKDLTNQQAVLRSLNTKMTTLKTAISDLMYSTSFNISGGVSSNKNVVDTKISDNAAHGVYHVNVTSIASNHVVKSKEFASDENDLVGLIGKELKINGTAIDWTGVSASNNNEFLEALAKKINERDDVSAAVVMTNNGDKTLTISSKLTGTANNITISGLVADSLEIEEARAATDAVFEVNGISITRSTNEINDVIQGLTLNLQSDGNSTITVKSDNDKIAEKIEAFVKAYNEVATLIKDNTGKEKLLQGNSTVRTLDMQLNSMINDVIGSEKGFKLLSEIGLEIDKGIVDPKQMTGKINFDKEKFLQKLNENPNAVMEMFTKDNTGLAGRMNKMLDSWTNSVDGALTVAIKGFQSNIDLVDENMERLLERLDKKEEALQKQFAAMEVALTELKNQQNWLAGQLNQLMTPIGKK